jgi:hypothetical protein
MVLPGPKNKKNLQLPPARLALEHDTQIHALLSTIALFHRV